MDEFNIGDGIIRQIIVDENNVVQAASIGGFIDGGIDVEDIPESVLMCPLKWCYENGVYSENPNYEEPASLPTTDERITAMEDAVQELILMQLGGE